MKARKKLTMNLNLGCICKKRRKEKDPEMFFFFDPKQAQTRSVYNKNSQCDFYTQNESHRGTINPLRQSSSSSIRSAFHKTSTTRLSSTSGYKIAPNKAASASSRLKQLIEELYTQTYDVSSNKHFCFQFW
jgi:hypothetical protein